FFGLIHAYELTPAGAASVFKINAAPAFSSTYLVIALILLLLHRFGKFPEIRMGFKRGGRGGRREGLGRRGPDFKENKEGYVKKWEERPRDPKRRFKNRNRNQNNPE